MKQPDELITDIFLTFLIITYRRPQKLARLLEIFLDERWRQLGTMACEIVIVDDHGEDESRSYTAPLVDRLELFGWSIKYIYRSENLRGDRNLYFGYSLDSRGKYVWFLCDDDLIDVDQAINYINTVYFQKPLVAICGFVQGRNRQYGNNLGSGVRLITDLAETIDYVIQFPKTTAYLLKRYPEDNLDILFERWDRTLYSWIGITIFLLTKHRDQALLLYPLPVARADNDYGVLRYSFRTFANLYFVVKDAVTLSSYKFEDIRSKLNNLTEYDPISLCIGGLTAHYNVRNEITYEASVVVSEIHFLKSNLFKILLRPKQIFNCLKLIVAYLSR